mmetsp:Transcript_11237/g.21026  ORF Transcript_11237/g.21026 Transcript_11237/m.21026 type:complete len:118 (+) Transcript_11237:166-519(+)
MGRFKGETGERNVLRVLVNVTRSGLEVRKLVERLARLLKSEGRDQSSIPGPAFCDRHGAVLSYNTLNTLFHEELQKIQEAHPELIRGGTFDGKIQRGNGREKRSQGVGERHEKWSGS